MTAETKKRLTRPTRPDRSQLDAQIDKLRGQISKCHDKMNELKATIDGIKEGRKGQGSATAGPRNKLIALRTELKGLYVSYRDSEGEKEPHVFRARARVFPPRRKSRGPRRPSEGTRASF